MVRQQYRVADLCRLYSSMNSKVHEVEILSEILYSLGSFFVNSTGQRDTVQPDAWDSELNTALLIIDSILSFIAFMKTNFPVNHQSDINKAIHHLKIKVTAMNKRIRSKTFYHKTRLHNTLAILDELKIRPNASSSKHTVSQLFLDMTITKQESHIKIFFKN